MLRSTRQQVRLSGRLILAILLFGILIALNALGAEGSVALAWDPSPDAAVTGYKIYYGESSRTYTHQVAVGNVTNTTITGLTAGQGYYFTATAYDDTGLESDYCNEVYYQAPIDAINRPPTLDAIPNVTLIENSKPTTVSLAGISTGGESGQSVSLKAASSNPAVVAVSALSYVSPNSYGSLALTPVAGAVGTSQISVTVDDGQAANNTLVRTFQVTILAANRPPTMNVVPDLTLQENAGSQTVLLSGISPGTATEIQTVTITATSSNPSLIPAPKVTYTSPSATGTLSFTPATGASGSAVVTVTLNDGQATDNTLVRTFQVTILAANRPPTLDPLPDLTVAQNSTAQSIPLTGVGPGAANETQTVTISALSSNPGLIPNPVIKYTSPNTGGVLSFTTTANASGVATITVTVSDGASVNGTLVRTFTVTVSAPISDAVVQKTVLANGAPALLVEGKAGASYRVEYTTDGQNWTPLTLVAAMSSSTVVPVGTRPANVSFRAVEFLADPPILQAHATPGSGKQLVIFGQPNAQYTLEYATDPGPNRTWKPLSKALLADSFTIEKIPDLGSFVLIRAQKN